MGSTVNVKGTPVFVASICRDSIVLSCSSLASCNYLFRSSIRVTGATMRSWGVISTGLLGLMVLRNADGEVIVVEKKEDEFMKLVLFFFVP